jgi:hypothetical protein
VLITKCCRATESLKRLSCLGHYQAISHDKHLHVMFSPAALPDFDNQKPDPKREAEDRKEMERLNCGFKKNGNSRR